MLTMLVGCGEKIAPITEKEVAKGAVKEENKPFHLIIIPTSKDWPEKFMDVTVLADKDIVISEFEVLGCDYYLDPEAEETFQNFHVLTMKKNSSFVLMMHSCAGDRHSINLSTDDGNISLPFYPKETQTHPRSP
jgi:hypothetical protein